MTEPGNYTVSGEVKFTGRVAKGDHSRLDYYDGQRCPKDIHACPTCTEMMTDTEYARAMGMTVEELWLIQDAALRWDAGRRGPLERLRRWVFGV